MGFSHVSPEELRNIAGLNDFFHAGSCFTQLDVGRGQKLLAAFRWRLLAGEMCKSSRSLSMEPKSASLPRFTFAFQPIVDVIAREVFSYEALLRGPGNEPAYQIPD
jgi:EAL domain-containing protein (putative c-di-GMP-specific phosphodiesterase class I)